MNEMKNENVTQPKSHQTKLNWSCTKQTFLLLGHTPLLANFPDCSPRYPDGLNLQDNHQASNFHHGMKGKFLQFSLSGL